MEQIEYTRTVVPSSMRSPYWKYFGFPSDNSNNILTRQKIVCTVCNTAITYNKNTSNLRTHLMSKHFEIFQRIIMPLNGTKEPISENDFCQTKLEEDSSYNIPDSIDVTPNKKQRKESSLEWEVNKVSDSCIIVPETNIRQTERHEDAMGKCWSELQIANCKYLHFEDNLNGSELVEVEELSDAESYDRKLEKISRNESTFALEVNNELQEKKLTESIEIMLADVIQTDLLTLDSLTRHGFCKYSEQLTGIRIDEGTIERIMEIIEKRFSKTEQMVNVHVADLSQMEPFSLSIETYEDNGQDKVMNIYYNYLNTNSTALDSILYRSCTINYKNPKISDILSEINLKNCSAIVVPSLGNVTNYVLDFAKSYDLPVVECLEFTLTDCLRNICETCELSADFERIIRNEIRISKNKKYTPKFGCYWSKLEVLENIFKGFTEHEKEQWQELQDCIDHLKPLKMALDILSDEQLSSCSLVRPIVIKLYEEHFAQNKYETSAKIFQIRKILQKELYEKIMMQNFLKEATFFDPRFQRDFAFSETAFALKEIKSLIVKRFKNILNTTEIRNYKRTETKETSNFLTNCEKSSSLKTFFKRDLYLKKLENVQDVKTDLDTELEMYHMNGCLDLDQSPAFWWQQASNCYKQLSKIAQFYLTVPCCYMPRVCRLDLEQRRLLLEQRKHLNQLCQTESKLWYLFYNNWITGSM